MFFSRGAVVYVVEGSHAPGVALHAGGAVLALGANDSDLFVETGLRVTEYSRATGRQLRHWTLTSLAAPVTSAGLDVAGNTVWAWTDWATDGSGFEYAQVDRMNTASSAVHVVDKDAFPGDMSADGAGLYFETVHGVTDDLAHASPTTSAVQYRKAPVDALFAVDPAVIARIEAPTSSAAPTIASAAAVVSSAVAVIISIVSLTSRLREAITWVAPAISSSAGAIIRHGPHHSAQKSTTTGPCALSTSASKSVSETLPTDI